LGQVRSASDRAGVPLLVVAAPTEWQVYDDLWPKLVGAGSQAQRRFSVTAPNGRLVEIAAHEDLHLVDLRETFRSEADGGGPPPIFRKDGHWTEAGHAVAARTVAAAIRDNNLTRLASTRH